MIFKIKIFLRTLEWADMELSDIIRAVIIMGASGPSAQIMSEQITSNKVAEQLDNRDFSWLPFSLQTAKSSSDSSKF